MVTAPASTVLEAARIQAGMSFRELWIAFLALGGSARPEVVRGYLRGSPVDPTDYDLLAQALNERFLDGGHDHPVPYHEDLG